MTRRELLERAALGAGALLCLVSALVLAVLAWDVSQSRAALSGGDVEFRIAPETAGLWRASTVVPFDAATRLLGAEDDIEIRQAVRAVRLARLGDPRASLSDPQVAIVR